ncbi:DUF2846 domain-containing protein [Mongoliitalea daihaiensis]|uniref:DUF2846 domain-containing protein n=1 Tax=Mongoliitalea daihaiensis TaxID=2782006 RepID=UPI001F1F5A73|nr:DUF2846 domain-containing protein [Mongoliitalea daihaiensis]UJP65856.1 hypothetical protein IPZ59_04315 [Mongoliitalea daihaiensis]
MAKWILVFIPLFFYVESSQISNKEKEAILVVYVKPSLNFSSFRLLLDEREVLPEIRRNTYYVIKTTPGRVKLETKGATLRNLTENKSYSLTLEAGKTYYLEAIREYQVLMSTLHLVRRPQQTGELAIEKMNAEYIDLTKSNL